VTRVKVSSSNLIKSFVASEENSKIVELSPGRKKTFIGLPYNGKSKIKVRLVRIELGKRNFEILIIPLLDESAYNHEIFKDGK
jgi:hypothetical protein